MSVIQKIRDRYGKIAGAVIGLALVGFIIQDGVNGSFGDMFGKDSSVAKVNGKKIDYFDYEQRKGDYETMYELFSDGRQLDAATRAQISGEVLNWMVYEKLVGSQQEDLGIRVSESEQKEMFKGANPDPMVQQFFMKIYGQQSFDPRMITEFEKNVPKNTPEGEKVWAQYESLKRFAIAQRLRQKFDAMVVNGIYTPKFLLERQLKDQASTASVRYVKVPYTSIEDAKVPVSEKDIQDYMNKHKAQFSIDVPTRSIDYVAFDILPSAEDTARSLGALNQLKGEFAATADAEAFVNRNSDGRYNDKFVTKKLIQSQYADSLINLPLGLVYGPYFENGAYHMARITEKRSIPDSVKAQHILIAPSQAMDDSAAHRQADSIKLAIEKGVSFDSLAAQYSTDQSNKAKGGDLGYFSYGTMVPEFNEAVFMGAKGDLKVVRTQFGWHVIRINDQKDFVPAAKIAIVSKDMTPSQVTNDAIYAKASEFAGKYANGKAFDDGVKKEALNKRVAENVRMNDFMVNGLGSARDVVRWMYQAKTGDVSNVFSIDGRYVVARLGAIQEAGLMKLDANTRPQVEALVKADKKAKMIADTYKGTSSLETLSASSKQPILQADSFNAQTPFVPNLGFEPKVVGYSFYDGFKNGTVSPAIQGADGVFYLSLVSRNIATAPAADPAQLAQQRMMLEMQNRNSISSGLLEAFKKGASIKYSSKNL